VRVALDRFQGARQLGFVELVLPDDVTPTENRRQRRAQFMRERGEKVVLHSIRVSERFDGLGKLHRAFLDPTFQLIGGGALGSVGELITYLVAAIGCIAIVALLFNSRRERRRYGFPTRPMWAEVLLGTVGCVAVVFLAWFANNNFWPKSLAAQYAADRGITPPAGGLQIPVGFPFPILLLIGVTVVMTWLATRRRFGRYVYAYGGNPDAAELAGINTRWTILKTYVVMGILCALAAAIASARLNGATLDVGVSYELYVIAAAAVGGTSFAGGIGTIPGAVLGAFVMQALAYGLSFLNVISPGQNIAVGVVLIVAVGLDTYNRRRGS